MFLKNITLHGFKSFADKIELDVMSGITGIVGPNGSGKSNVSDAVKWVLGEQSARQLRGNTMSDVIFNGSEKRKMRQYCEVSLTFDNSDHALPSDYEEIMVTRRVYRSGNGEYFINKTECRRKDIVDLFHDTGIGKDGYSLIGQGRIDEILSLKGEDRRQIFEEAAGIVKFKTRKNEAERSLEAANQNLTRIDDIIGELERSLKPLESQSENARKYLKLRDELKGLELAAFAVSFDKYNSRINELTLQSQELSKKIEENEKQILEGQQNADELESVLDEADAVLSSVRDEVLSLTRSAEALQGERNLSLQKAEQVKEHKAQLEKNIELSKQKLLELSSDMSPEKISAQEKIIKELEAKEESAQASLLSMQESLREMEDELESKKAQVISSLNRLSDTKAAFSRLNAMKENILSRLDDIDSRKSVNEDRLDDARIAVENAKKANERAYLEHENLKKLEKQAQDKQNELREKLSGAFSRQEKAQGALREVEARLKLLTQLKDDFEGYTQSVKEVMRFSRGRQTGIHGVIASLISVPKQYERAIEMALGAQSQHIVCDDEQSAKNMIEYLRKNRYGRATFLPISTVSGRGLNANEEALLSMDGCIGVASDLISYDKKYAQIVKSLLGRTVIAKDLDSGIEIMRRARHSFRLVTLDGDIMNPGGAMTGGSVNSRVTSLISREREIAEHTQSVKKLREEADKASSFIESSQKLRDEAREELAAVSYRVHQQDIACTREQLALERANDEYKARQGDLERSHQEKEQLSQALLDIENRLSAMEKDRLDQSGKSDDDQKFVDKLSMDVSNQRELTENKREELTAIREKCIGARSELSLLLRDEQQVEKERERLLDGISLDEKELETIKYELPELENKALELERELIQKRALLDSKTADLRQKELERTKLSQNLRSVNDDLLVLRNLSSELSDKNHRCELQLSRAQSELKTLSDRIFEDYEITYAMAAEYVTEDFEPQKAQRRIGEIRSEIRKIGSVNVNAVEEYQSALTRYQDMSAQREDITKAMDDLNSIISRLKSKMEKQFTEQFTLMQENFKVTFARLFGGGEAQLKLSDASDPLNCGIEIIAQPPGKKLTLLSLLSGGERALTAIAILFAILMLKPTPFCILDEIDAALDEANVVGFATFLKEFSKSTQFIVVSHRKGTMESCDALYGVAMEEKGVSKIVSVKLT